MLIETKELRRIEKLAALKVSQEKEAEVAQGLAKVFDWVDQLKEVDISNTQPLTNPVLYIKPQTPLRDDIAHLDNSKEDVLLNAPDQDHGFFLVPKVVE